MNRDNRERLPPWPVALIWAFTHGPWMQRCVRAASLILIGCGAGILTARHQWAEAIATGIMNTVFVALYVAVDQYQRRISLVIRDFRAASRRLLMVEARTERRNAAVASPPDPPVSLPRKVDPRTVN